MVSNRKSVTPEMIEEARKAQSGFSIVKQQMNLHTILVHFLLNHFPDRSAREKVLIEELVRTRGALHNVDCLFRVLDTIAFCREGEFEFGIRNKDGTYVDLKNLLLRDDIPGDRLLGFLNADAEEIATFF